MKPMEILCLIDKCKADFGDLILIERDASVEDDLQFRIYHPFYFDDGDHLGLVLKRVDNRWAISDRGHFFFHMGIFVDDEILHSGNNKRYIDRCRAMFDVEDREGELIVFVEEQDFGRALTDFLQFFMRAMHVELLINSQKRKYNLQKN